MPARLPMKQDIGLLELGTVLPALGLLGLNYKLLLGFSQGSPQPKTLNPKSMSRGFSFVQAHKGQGVEGSVKVPLDFKKL